MLRLVAAFSPLIALSLHASVIDSGVILNRFTHGMGDADVWSVTMASSAGNYSVYFKVDAAVDVSYSCRQVPNELGCDVFPSLPQGYTATIIGHTIGDYGASGSANVDGVNYPNVGYKGTYVPAGSPGGVFYSSNVSLQSAPFVLAPGSFSIPFTMSGTLLGATFAATSLVVDDQITGSGTVTFTLRPVAGPDTPLMFVPFTNLGGDPSLTTPPQMRWTFATPEPSTWFVVFAGLLVFLPGIVRPGISRPNPARRRFGT